MRRGVTRRQFLRRALGGSAVLLAAGRWPQMVYGQAGAPGQDPGVRERSPVIRVTSPKVMDPYGTVDREQMFEMINRALMGLTGKFTLTDIVGMYAEPEDRVGVLTNRAWGLAADPNLVEFMCLWATQSGVPQENVLLWEGHSAEYNQDGLARRFVEECTVIFSIPSLYAHWRLGMVGALANILGLLRDPEPYYQARGQGIGRLWANPVFRRKHKLVIMDALWPYSGSGAAYDPKLRWRQQSVMVSEDPVAIDVVGRQMLLERRRLHHGRDWPLEPPADYIEEADTTYHVGHSSMDDIDLRDVWL